MSKNKNIAENYISFPRLQPYLSVCEENIEKALRLYQINMKLGASFLPLMSILEVSMRNAIDRELQSHFGCQDWWDKLIILLQNKKDIEIEKLKKEYGRLPSGYTHSLESVLGQLKGSKSSIIKEKKKEIKRGIRIHYRKKDLFKNKNELEQLSFLNQKLKDEIERNPIMPSHSHLVSSANFSLWTSMFEKEPFKANRGKLIQIFTNRQGVNLKEIRSMLEDIRLFRNRIAHNEPLFFKKGKLDLSRVIVMNNNLIKLLDMLDEDIKVFSQETMTIYNNINSIEEFIEHLSAVGLSNKIADK